MDKQGPAPSKRLGVKFLSEPQLHSTFPDKDSLMERIEEQRAISQLAGSLNYNPADRDRFPQMYDNVYALLGGRGSGKSSVLLTLQKTMEQTCPQDIMLPLITPEIISEKSSSILGWILSASETVVKRIEALIEKEGRSVEPTGMQKWLNGFFADCQFRKKDNSLREKYHELFMRSMRTNDTNISNYSVEDAIYYKMDQSMKQYQLIQDLNEFWKYLTDTWKKARQLQRGSEPNSSAQECPLIILMFDDIDLVPERSMELLTTTFQYLTAPNIVIILTAAEKVLYEVIRLKMVERMIGSESSSLLRDFVSQEIIDGREQSMSDRSHALANMTEEFYNKVIPPSSRYYLHRYQTIAERKYYYYSSLEQSFALPSEKGTNGRETIEWNVNGQESNRIDAFLKGQIDQLIQALPENLSKEKLNFLLPVNDKNGFRDAFLLMFGQKNRNIANGCLEIMNTVSRLRAIITAYTATKGDWALDDWNFQEVIFPLRHLFRSLTLSNPNLRDFSDHADLLIRPRQDIHRVYIDYPWIWKSYLRERTAIFSRFPLQTVSYQGELQNHSENRRFREEALRGYKQKLCALITVLFFVEGILSTLDNRERGIHGHRELSFLLNADVNSDASLLKLSAFPLHESTLDFLDRSPRVLENAGWYIAPELNEPQEARKYLIDTFGTGFTLDDAVNALSRFARQDREWVKTVMTALSICFSGITLTDQRLLYISENLQRTLDLTAFGGRFNQAQKEAALKFMAENDLMKLCRKKLDEFPQNISQQRNLRDCATALGIDFTSSKIEFFEKWFDKFEDLQHKDTMAAYLWAFASDRWAKIAISDEKYIQKRRPQKEKRMETASWIIHFFEYLLESCMEYIQTDTNILLSKENLSDILSTVRQITPYNNNIRRSRDRLEHLVKKVLPKDPGADQSEEVYISSQYLFDYLDALGRFLYKSDYSLRDNHPFYIDQADIVYFFELQHYLQLTDRKDSPISFYGFKDMSMTTSLAVATALNTLQMLMEYYFAAHIWTVYDTHDPNKYLWDNGWGSLEPVDLSLRRLFSVLISEQKTCCGIDVPENLHTLMRETQSELAQQYYSYLEATHE